ncbi:MAG: cupredoxin family copper-binding protein [Cyanobacteria bacterium REEB65]|nr:cupredoxin family copper-binding protein [Cyanobacteria bacterium REEB65]
MGSVPLASADIAIRAFAFSPAVVAIGAGERVAWTNQDAGIAHTVTANDRAFDSGPIAPGSSWSHVFTEPGTYSYHCTPHPFMRGTLIVR